MEPVYRDHVRRGYPTLAELFRAGEVVEDLLSHPGWAAVQGIIGRELSDIDGQLGGSRPLEHVQYAHLHGQMRGLRASMDVAHAIRDHAVAVRAQQESKHESTGESVGER